ncbi:10600_t:CDS:2 [Funneliformis geosporum]|uniref:13593_t:CDS:1 n=1 Tax=Funneliformis geosporum TaxID=1117311 RepID=A0A9W4SN95_9GLOM|nr:10600_t:CDS:2 [Funneliformis geosporum]CAI2175342.1 13593_t:CDS:2 [Funneliformis geosporum]
MCELVLYKCDKLEINNAFEFKDDKLLQDDMWKNIDSLYCESFINTLSQHISATNNEQVLMPRYYNNIQEVQVEEREAKDHSTITEVFYPLNNTVKLHNGWVYNVNNIKDLTVRRGKVRPPNK